MADHEDRGYLADRLEELFDQVRTPTGSRYKLKEVMTGVNSLAGRNLISVQYLSQLHLGQRRNPSFIVLDAIAAWFGVPTDYFSCLRQVPAQRGSRFRAQGVGPILPPRCEESRIRLAHRMGLGTAG